MNIIEMLDDSNLPLSLANSLSTLISFEECRQIVYSGDAPPLVVFDSLQENTYQSGMANYLSSSYAINPTYRMYRAGKLSGVHRLRDIAHFKAPEIDLNKYRVSAVATEEIGYLTEGMPAGNEELCVGLNLPGGVCAMIYLTRQRSMQGFSSDEVCRISAVAAFLTSAFRRYWQKSRQRETIYPSEFGLLSPREREIAQLLIKGHSTLSISLRLNISVTTVKTHRKNLYFKLNISTQCELFSLYANSLQNELVSLR
ncbi:helix-turn-helix domain-containing protein [Mesorhizobium sp. CO1-1-8]|uniref:helix-turn-helix domain-containing protein n=1 Tax=Mesorhizobium sp. CO1-1-8 TaxID=2876631 RepID=UPI001CD09B0B|nr:helix-turn-helix transcriptional regulator [Mesorhizobium sp. CO1-1-8]MBZ9772191.1 helix-turn-helix transcriptional regulator [Mesorhizobium sp. CO1-1-8]